MPRETDHSQQIPHLSKAYRADLRWPNLFHRASWVFWRALELVRIETKLQMPPETIGERVPLKGAYNLGLLLPNVNIMETTDLEKM